MIEGVGELEIEMERFEIGRGVRVYGEGGGVGWWRKGWLNKGEEGEGWVEIEGEEGIGLIEEKMEKDVWVEEFYGKEMEI